MGRPLKTIRSKGTGRVFVRGQMWYFRYRFRGHEVTKATGVRVADESEEAFEDSRRRAIRVLEGETEVLRLKDRESRLQVIKVMLENTQDRIRDAVACVQRSATLAQLPEIFAGSSRRGNCSAKQFAVYDRYMRTLAVMIGGTVLIRDIDEGLADTFASRLAAGISPNTYNKHLNGYTLIWDAIAGRVGITTNPWKTIPRKRLDTSVRRALTESEVGAILDNSHGELHTLIVIGLYTGLRLGDAVHLRWADIHDNAVFVTTRKTDTAVGIPLHAMLRDELARCDEFDDFIMPELVHKYDSQGNSAITRKVHRLFDKCGIETSRRSSDGRLRPVCGFHSLRSTFVTRCTAAGIPQAVVQALVGHASQRMTAHYTHLSNADILANFAQI